MLTGARKRPYDSSIARHHRPDTFLRVGECYHRVALGASVEHEMGDILWEDLNPHASERFSHENTCHERRVVGQGEVEAFGSVSDLTLRAPERVVVPHSPKASATRQVPTIFTLRRVCAPPRAVCRRS